jgi:hypothetical protein
MLPGIDKLDGLETLILSLDESESLACGMGQSVSGELEREERGEEPFMASLKDLTREVST